MASNGDSRSQSRESPCTAASTVSHCCHPTGQSKSHDPNERGGALQSYLAAGAIERGQNGGNRCRPPEEASGNGTLCLLL